MKRITAIAVVLLASLAVAGSAWAQTPAIKANIPFGFYVMNKWVPPGTYTMKTDTKNPNVVFIASGANKVAMLDSGYNLNEHPGPGKLVFHVYGNHYFLSAIRCSSCQVNVGFYQSKLEKEEQINQASNHSKKNVYLALR